MGVHGLTTYLHENQAAIAKYLHFPTEPSDGDGTPFVIDGWSFIYEILSLTDLPWVYGGEYNNISLLIEKTVLAWLRVGLRLYFVFDGPYPAIKFPTIVSRATKTTIKDSKLFFVTSAVARSKRRFLRELGIMPPRAYVACVETLKRVIQSIDGKSRLEIHFADEEGDPYAVEFAARLGGYVAARDSDFVVLNAEGYKGYIPMDEMVWTPLAQDIDTQQSSGNDGGFQTVINTKTRKKALLKKPRSERGIIPPKEVESIQLSIAVYSPEAVASHLRIPISLLPLLGALVGNDFTGSKDPSAVTAQEPNLQWLFFERQLTVSQRITRVANTLHDILAAALSPAAKGKQKAQVSSVMQLIDRAVNALLIRSPDSMPSGERERVIDRIVEATLQYAIPRAEGIVQGLDGLWTSPICALHTEGSCPLMRYLSPPPVIDMPSPSHEELRSHKNRDDVRSLYVTAYRSGKFDPRLMDTMSTGTFWYRQSLENPDIETVSVSIARPIQEVSFAVLDSGLGLPEQPEEAQGKEDEEFDEEDEDKLVDVVEESDEDYLAPLRGAIQQLATPADSDDETMTDIPPSKHLPFSRLKVIEERVRRGIRLASENVSVPALSEVLSHYNMNTTDDLPIQLADEEYRTTFFLRVLQSDLPSVRALSPGDTLMVIALRWVVSRLHLRAEEVPTSKERMKERWSKPEAQSYLASFFESSQVPADEEENDPPIENRNIQLVAQVSAAFEAIERLGQLLLLSDRYPTPVLRFSGKLFHSYLTGIIPLSPDIVPSALWDASIERLEHAYSEPIGKKKKKASQSSSSSGPSPPSRNPKGAGFNGGMFGLLGDMEV